MYCLKSHFEGVRGGRLSSLLNYHIRQPRTRQFLLEAGNAAFLVDQERQRSRSLHAPSRMRDSEMRGAADEGSPTTTAVITRSSLKGTTG